VAARREQAGPSAPPDETERQHEFGADAMTSRELSVNLESLGPLADVAPTVQHLRELAAMVCAFRPRVVAAGQVDLEYVEVQEEEHA
jgi:hypothetical protein